jgi:cysteine desulfurase / selenocysteine lyase
MHSPWAEDARRFEPGSPNLLGIHALRASLSLLQEVGLNQIAAAIDDRWQRLHDGLLSLGCEILTPAARHAGILTFRPAHGDTETLFRRLQDAGVLCAQRGGGIRFSPHFYLPLDGLDAALALVAEGPG